MYRKVFKRVYLVLPVDKTRPKSTPDHFTSFRMVLRSESPPDTITLEPGRHPTCRTDYKTSFLTGGHNSIKSVSPDVGHNFGGVKQSESVGRSREASGVILPALRNSRGGHSNQKETFTPRMGAAQMDCRCCTWALQEVSKSGV